MGPSPRQLLQHGHLAAATAGSLPAGNRTGPEIYFRAAIGCGSPWRGLAACQAPPTGTRSREFRLYKEQYMRLTDGHVRARASPPAALNRRRLNFSPARPPVNPDDAKKGRAGKPAL